MIARTSPYALSFTTGGLFVAEASVAARLYDELNEWRAVRQELASGRHVAFRTKATANRVSREIVSRLELLNREELSLLAEGALDARVAIAWIAACRRFEMIADFARTVIAERVATKRADLGPADFDRFVEAQSVSHPELDEISPTTHAKLRQVLMRMLNEAGFVTKSGNLSFYALPHQLESMSTFHARAEQDLFPVRATRKRSRGK